MNIADDDYKNLIWKLLQIPAAIKFLGSSA